MCVKHSARVYGGMVIPAVYTCGKDILARCIVKVNSLGTPFVKTH